MLIGYLFYSFIHKGFIFTLINDIDLCIVKVTFLTSFSIISLLTISSIINSENNKKRLQLETTENNKKILDLNKKLTDSNKTLETLIDTMPAGIIIVDKTGEIIKVNCEAKRVMGIGLKGTAYGAENGTTLHELDGEPIKPENLPLAKTTDMGEKVKNKEVLVKSVDGNETIILVSSTPIANSKDNISGAVGIFKDITELKNTQEKLRHSEEINNAIINSITEELSLTDIKGNILSINKIGENRLFPGKLPNGLIGTNIYDLLPPELWDERKETINYIIKNKLPMEYETDINDNNYKNIFYPVFDKHHEVSHIVTFSQDITKFKKYDNMRRSFINEIVKERKKLQIKNEELEIANNIKNDFIANVSHELKSPLNIIMTHLEYFLDENIHSLDEESIDILNIAYKNSDRLKDMISNMLDISSIESQKLEFDYNSLNIVEFISNIVEDRKIVVKNKDIDIKFQCEYKNINIFTDKLRLRQVIDNLLDNAIKFTIAGNVFLSIRVYKKHIEVSIKDSGIGIDDDKLSRIFDPFYQVDSSTKKKFSGVGLGLSISKRIIEKMGGDIFVKNNIDKGCTFTVKIPFE